MLSMYIVFVCRLFSPTQFTCGHIDGDTSKFAVWVLTEDLPLGQGRDVSIF